jgi:hypothetical protein
MGAQVIVGVRKKQLGDARSLSVADPLAIDDDEAVAKIGVVDAIAETVGGEVTATLLAKVKPVRKQVSRYLEGPTASLAKAFRP